MRGLLPLLLALILPVGALWTALRDDPERARSAHPPIGVECSSSRLPAEKSMDPAQGLYGVGWGRPIAPAKGETVEPQALFHFAQWADEWLVAAPEIRPALLAAGKDLARQRRDALREMIAEDPEAALAAAVPLRVVRTLPKEILPFLERRVAGEGDLWRIASLPQTEGAPFDAPSEAHFARVGGQTFRAYLYGRRNYQNSLNNTPLHGIAIDNLLAVHENPVRLTEDGELADAHSVETLTHSLHDTPAPRPPVVQIGSRFVRLCCVTHLNEITDFLVAAEGGLGPGGSGTSTGLAWTTGPKSLLAIRVDFPDLPGTPVLATTGTEVTPTASENLISQHVAPWFEEVSYGKTTIVHSQADVTPVFRMPKNASYYAVGDSSPQGIYGFAIELSDHAIAAAGNAGFNPATYDRVAIVFSDLSDIPGSRMFWSGLGLVGGEISWFNGYYLSGTVIHEMGHGFGLPHANFWSPPTGSSNPVDPNGQSVEYEDVFDRMGIPTAQPIGTLAHFNPHFLHRLGWLPENTLFDLQETGPASQTVRIHRYDHPQANVAGNLALRIPRDAEADYWVSLRGNYPTPVDQSAYVIWGYNDNRQSNLLRLNPAATDNNEAPLPLGETFQDADAGIALSVVGAGGTSSNQWIDVQVVQTARIELVSRIVETPDNAGTVEVTARRTGYTGPAVSVSYATANGPATPSPGVGTALAGTHYQPVSGTLTWAADDSDPITLSIPILSGSPTQTLAFHVTISDPTGDAVITPGTHTTETRIVRPGSPQGDFSHPEFNGVAALTLELLDGTILATGSFTEIGYPVPVAQRGLTRLNPDGSPTPGFFDFTPNGPGPASDPWQQIQTLAQQPDGNLLVGGSFTTFNGSSSASRIARLLPNGALDPSFDTGTGPNNTVNSIAVQADGRILVGGSFTSFNGQPANRLVRLLPNGEVDPGFTSSALGTLTSNEVYSLAFAHDGELLIGGFFNLSTTSLRRGITRIDRLGNPSSQFSGLTSGVDGGSVFDIHPLADGRTLISGAFNEYNSTARKNAARILANGALDTSFGNPSISCNVQGSASDPLGRLIVSGFSGPSNNTTGHLIRLLANGSPDPSFTPPGSLQVAYDVTSTADGGLLASFIPDPFMLEPDNALRKLHTATAGPGFIAFADPVPAAFEGQTLAVRVGRYGGSNGAVAMRVALAHTGNSAQQGIDFIFEDTILHWTDGDASEKTVPIHLPPGTEGGTRTFLLQLGEGVGTRAGMPAVATATINQPTHRQAWRIANFGSPLNAGPYADHADFDGDGIANLVEYALGLNPTDGRSPVEGAFILPRVTQTANGPENGSSVTFSLATPSPPPPGVSYRIETSTSLLGGSWQTVATRTHGGSWTLVNDDFTLATEMEPDGSMRLRIGFPPESGTMFARLRLDPAEP